MNKRMQIVLILVITLVMLLGLTVPSMAKKNPTFSCFINPIIVKNNGEIITYAIKVYGELEAYWDDGTLVNICAGDLPLGEPINASLTYADFNVYCEMMGPCSNNKLIYEDFELGKIWDPDGGYHSTDSRTFILMKNGKFSFTNYYTP